MSFPDSGDIFYEDDYQQLYQVIWETVTLDGSEVLDFTTIVKQPYVWGEDAQGYIKDKVVYRRGVCTTIRQIFISGSDGYVVLAEGMSQVICVFPTTFSGDGVPADGFEHHVDSAVSDFFEHEITCGSRFSDPEDAFDEGGTAIVADPIVFAEVDAFGTIIPIAGKEMFQFVNVWGQDDNLEPCEDTDRGLLFYAPFRASLDFLIGSGIATFTGGDNGTIIDADGLVQSVPANTPRFFGARYSGGTYYDTTADGAAIPMRIDEIYPDGGGAIGDSQTNNTYSYSVILERKLGLPVDNFGTGGHTLSSIYTNLITNGLNKDYDFYVVQGGINDIVGAGSDPNASMQATLAQIADALVAAGITPIFLGISPWGANASWNATKQGYTDTYNTWLESYCTTNSYTFLDLYDLFEDPVAVDDLHSDYDSGDGLHWNTAADAAIGEVLYYGLVPNILRGLCLEGAVQNLAIYAEDASDAAWVKTGVSQAVETETAPDGATSVDKLTCTNPITRTMLQTVTAALDDYCFSCWLKLYTSNVGWIELTADGGATWVRQYVIDTWQRFDVTANTTNPQFGLRMGNVGESILFWGGQLNTGKYPNSYVPTIASAVTKAAETLTIPTSSNFDTQLGTAVFQLQKLGTYLERDAASDIGVWDTGNTAARLAYSGSSLYLYKYGADANHIQSMSNIPVFDRLTSIKLGVTWDTSGVNTVFAQDDPVKATITAADGVAESLYNTVGADLYIGSRIDGYQLNCYIQGFWIYAEVMDVTHIEGGYPM